TPTIASTSGLRSSASARRPPQYVDSPVRRIRLPGASTEAGIGLTPGSTSLITSLGRCSSPTHRKQPAGGDCRMNIGSARPYGLTEPYIAVISQAKLRELCRPPNGGLFGPIRRGRRTGLL